MVCPAVFAQEDYSKYEIFAGYSLLRVVEYDDMNDMQEELLWYSDGESRLKKSRFLEKGFSTSFTYNFTSSVGLEASLRRNNGYVLSLSQRGLGTETEEGFKRTDFALLAGPRFTIRNVFSSVTPFVYGLVGLSRDSVAYAWDENYWGYYDSSSEKLESHNSLGFALGGGLDIPIHENVAIRAIQADYYRATHAARPFAAILGAAEGGTKPFENINLSFGLVIRFGGNSK
jgi:opacity protein-like surface antigen